MRAMVTVSIVLFKAGYEMLFDTWTICYILGDRLWHKIWKISGASRTSGQICPCTSRFPIQAMDFIFWSRKAGWKISFPQVCSPGWYVVYQGAIFCNEIVRSVLHGFQENRENKYIKISEQIREEWLMWIFFLSQNTGSPWKSFNNVFLQADMASDASGRAFAGVVDFPTGWLK